MGHGSKLDPFGSKFLSIWLESMAKELMVRVDNAPAHNLRVMRSFVEHNRLKRFPHSPYSPDISPSDFYLCGKVKRVLIVLEISDEISLLDVVTEILNVISTDELRRVFRSWIERVDNIITAEGAVHPAKYRAYHSLM
jgi:histone-lysine N-methyltransferase SETMAR